MSTSQVVLNALRPSTGSNASMVGQMTALQMLQSSQNPRDILLSEALNGVVDAINAINRILQGAPTLKLLVVDSADIQNLTVGGASGPGQMTVDGGPPSYPAVGWVGQNPSSNAPVITITNFAAGTGTTSTPHGLAANQIVLIAGTSDSTLNGYWTVATVPTTTTLTLSGYSGNSTGGTLQRQFFGGWFKTLAVGGSSFYNAITNGLYADESGKLTVNALTVRGELSGGASLSPSWFGPNGALSLVGVTFTNNSPVSGEVAWSSGSAVYKGVTYTISAGNTPNSGCWIYWQLSNPTVLQTAVGTPPALGADDFVVGFNVSFGNPQTSGYFSPALEIHDSTGNRLLLNSNGVTQYNGESEMTFNLTRTGNDGGGAKGSGLIAVNDGTTLSGGTFQMIGGTGYLQGKVFTFATLPSPVANGARAMISDCTTTTFGAVAAGGGANSVPVYRSGTNWLVG